MSQAAYLKQVLKAVSSLDPKKMNNIFLARNELLEVVKRYGEDGQMGLAILGLEFAVDAEAEKSYVKQQEGSSYSGEDQAVVNPYYNVPGG